MTPVTDPTPEELAAWEAACEAAPLGPWTAELDVFDSEEGIEVCLHGPDLPAWMFTAGTDVPAQGEGIWVRAEVTKAMAVGRLCALARTALPRTIRALREAMKRKADLRAEVDALRATNAAQASKVARLHGELTEASKECVEALDEVERLTRERDEAYRAGQEAMRERAAETCEGLKYDDGGAEDMALSWAVDAIRALPIDAPAGAKDTE